MDRTPPAPTWLPLLSAMENEWREAEIENGRNPDSYLESVLRAVKRWPRAWTPAHA